MGDGPPRSVCRHRLQTAQVLLWFKSIAEAMFSINVDGFFMEFDSARAGSFELLRFLPAGKRTVLGLVTTKQGAIESDDEIRRRIDAASA